MIGSLCRWCTAHGYSPAQASEQSVLDGARVLVLGASGLIGSALVEYLLHLNDHGVAVDVVAVGRSRTRLAERFHTHERLALVQWDVSEEDAPAQIGRVSHIVHAASNATPATIVADPVGTMMANINGTSRALELSRKEDAAFLLVSSSEAYGRIDSSDPIKEEAQGVVPLDAARSAYPVSKRAAETLVASYIHQHAVRATIVRPGFVFGPQIGSRDDRVIPQFVRHARAGEAIEMKSDGLLRRSYVFVSDCVMAIVLVMTSGERGRAYNVSNPACDVTIREIAETVARAGGTRVKFVNPSDADLRGLSTVSSGLLDTSALRGLGWEPQVDMKLGLSLTVEQLEEVK